MRIVILALLSLAPLAWAEDYPGAPASVTAAYLEADGAGAALDPKTVPELLRFTTWKSLGESKSQIVIKSYDIGEVGWSDDEATVQIIYHVAGELDGLVFKAKPSDETIDFDLVRKDGKWKLVKPQVSHHLFIDAAIRALESAKDDPSAEASLKELRKMKIEQEEAANRSTEEKMRMIVIPRIRFEAVLFREALEFLKLYMIMRTADEAVDRSFGITFIAGVPATPSSPGAGQLLEESRVTMSAENVSFEEALREITKQAGLKYSLENGVVYISPESAPSEK